MTSSERYHLLRSQGICTACKKAPARENRALCQECADKASKSKAFKAELRVKRGLCPQCGRLPIEKGKKLCYVCTGNNRDISALRREEYRAKGLCLCCGTRPAVDGFVHCQPCRDYKAKKERERKARNRAA